jgi:hypothetical protein
VRDLLSDLQNAVQPMIPSYLRMFPVGRATQVHRNIIAKKDQWRPSCGRAQAPRGPGTWQRSDECRSPLDGGVEWTTAESSGQQRPALARHLGSPENSLSREHRSAG